MKIEQIPQTDMELLRRFSRGNVKALGQLAGRHEVALLGLACGLLGGRQDLARDCVQDCWLRVIKYGKGFDGRASFKTWLYRMVINRARDLRERHKVVSLNGVAGHGVERDAELWLEASGGKNVLGVSSDRNSSECGDRGVDGDRLRRAVEALSEGTRLIVLLCYHRGMTHEVAAEILGIPVGTLKSRLHAGLCELRDALDARAGEQS